jgi:hypothetical protein
MNASHLPMENSVTAEAPVDRRRLQFITQGVSAQGLCATAVGALFLLQSVVEPYRLPWLRLFTGAASIAAVFLIIRIPRYYEHRFGRVEPRTPSTKQLILLVAMLVALCVLREPLGLLVAHAAGRSHALILDPGQRIEVFPFLLWIAMLGVALFRPREPISERVGFAFCGAVASGFVVFYPLWRPGSTHLIWWRILNSGSLGIFLIALGLYDHFTLVRLLPKRVEEADSE